MSRHRRGLTGVALGLAWALISCASEAQLRGDTGNSSAVEDTGEQTPSPTPTDTGTAIDDAVDEFLVLQSNLLTEAFETVQGVAVRDIGGAGIVGVGDALQLVDCSAGWGKRIDLLGESEQIVQSRVFDEAWLVAVRAGNEAALVHGETGELVQYWNGPTLRGVGVDGDSLLVIRETPGPCQATWVRSYVETTRIVPSEICEQDVTVGAFGGVALVAGGGRMWKITADSIESLGGHVDELEWDHDLGQVYGFAHGGSTAVAFTWAGQVRWSSELQGRVVSMAALPTRRAVAVLLDSVDGAFIVMLDGDTGKELARQPINALGDQIVAAGDGSIVANVWSAYVEFYLVGEFR